MEGHLGETLVVSNLGATRSRALMHRVITLVEAAVGQLHNQEHAAQGKLLEAASLLRRQIDPPAAREVPDTRGCLLAWQARKVRDYIDSHITGPVLVADLCALVQRSEAHFSRSFKRTFGESPHSFVVRRRVELAAQYMLTTDASLSDIALGCGFTDQPHLCKHFRQAAGETPAAWRRAHRSHHDENGTPPVERFATASRNGTPVPHAVLPLLNRFGCVPVCGKSLTLRGFINDEFADAHYEQSLRTVSADIADGRIRYREEITNGVENAPKPFIEMLKGRNFGKTFVRVAMKSPNGV